MAKHDQRILKFLNQNADRAPTITDMMTRLNISISDISESLSSLQGQGLISMKTNSQGIECWFPANSALQQTPQPTPAQPGHSISGIQSSSGISPAVTAPSPVSSHSAWDNRAQADRTPSETMPPVTSGLAEPAPVRPAPDPAPSPYTPNTFTAPAPQTPSLTPAAASADRALASAAQVPPTLEITGAPPAFVTGTQASPYSTGTPFSGLSQPAPKSIGMGTFAFGLIAAIGVSAWLGGFMAEKKIEKAASDFADKKSLAEATSAFSAFRESTHSQVAALETEIKKLSTELAVAKAAADSIKLAEAAKPGPVKRVNNRRTLKSRARSASR